MAGQRIPGPIGTDPGPMTRIDSGTSARMATPAPGGICAAPEHRLQGPVYTLDTHDLGLVDTVQAAAALWAALEQSWDHVARIVAQETGVVVDAILKGILPAIGIALGVLAASAALGAAAGAALGALAGGVGAVPGAVAGGQAGALLGVTTLEWLGLGFLVVEIGGALGQIHDYAGRATRRAVNSLFVPSHQRAAEITLAAQDYARAQAELIKAVLMGLVALLLKQSAVASTARTQASVTELAVKLRASRLGEGFAVWLETNWQALVGNAKLRPQVKRSTAPTRSTEVFTPSQLARRTPTPSAPEPAAPIARTSPVQGTHPLGHVAGKYTAMDPTGPLPDNMAGTFSGGRYTAVKLQKDTVLYRAGTADQPLGQFFSQETPASVIQTRIDKAVLPEWPDGAKSPLDTIFAVKIPAGTEVYIGEVGAQGGLYVGGTPQVVVVKPWAIEGVKVIHATPLP